MPRRVRWHFSILSFLWLVICLISLRGFPPEKGFSSGLANGLVAVQIAGSIAKGLPSTLTDIPETFRNGLHERRQILGGTIQN
jgi:hypothetical protein